MSSTASPFLAELALWGPQSSNPPLPLAEAQAYCQQLAQSHYENFSVVSWLLPKELRQHFANVYAYCRWSDDLADEVGSTDRSLELLEWWEDSLRDAFAGHAPRHPVFVALQSTTKQFELPIAPFQKLLQAFRQDQTVTRYADDLALLQYCEGSANPVGQIVLGLARTISDEDVQLSDKICTGLQIANFCQDIAIDANKGRIYIPRSRWKNHAVDEAMIMTGKVTPQLQALLREWVQYARNFLGEGKPLIRRVPKWLSLDIDLFISGGCAILDAIERANFDVWSTRVKLNRARKLQLVAAASGRWALRGVTRTGSHVTRENSP